MIERIVDAIRPAFNEWGYLIVGVAGFLENSVGAGLLIPGETMVILGGFYAATGGLSVVWIAVVASVAGVAGDNVGYLLGRRYGRRLLDRFGRLLFLTPRRLDRAERFYRRHGGKTVFLGRFIPVVRSLGCVVAGMSNLSYRRFLFYDAAGAVLWAIGNTIIGYLLGLGYEGVERWLGPAGVAALVLLVALVGVSAWWGRRKIEKKAVPEVNPDPEGADTPGDADR